MNYWVLGFLWGSSRFSGDYLLAQNRDKNLLLKLKELSKIENKIFQTTATSGRETYRVKVRRDNPYVLFMLDNGYEGRQGNEERNAPVFSEQKDEREFLKGYFSTHYSLDIARNGKRTFKRLRFYAAENILTLLNNHLHMQLGTTIKKIGGHGNSNVCKILYYQSKREVPEIIDYLELERDVLYEND